METRPQSIIEAYGTTLALSSLITFSIVFLIRHLWSQDSNVPTVLKNKIPSTLKRQNHFYQNARSTLASGYKSFPNKIWRLDTPGGHRLILPVSLLDELKSHPAISLNAATDHIFMKEITGLGGQAPHKLQIFKSKITPSLPRYAPVLHEIIRTEIPVLFNMQTDWTSTTVQDKLAELVSKTAARVFHGEQASQNDQWLQLAPQYVGTLMEYIGVLRAWPSFLRPLVALFTKQRGEVNRMWQQGSTIIEQSLISGTENDPPSLLDLSRDQTLAEVVETQMAMVIAGVLTTAATCTHVLLDIAAHPEAIAELREEVQEVYESCGGTLDKKSLGKLEKLDSWMKESIRLNNADMATFQRQATQDVKLSTGFIIPKGTTVEIPLHAIQTDETTFENPLEFDGFRYHRMRQTPGNESKNTFVSSGKQDLAWGYGRHACPGRWLAEMQIKMILAEILIQFDVKNREGQPRSRNIEVEASIMPDPKAEVLMRRVNAV